MMQFHKPGKWTGISCAFCLLLPFATLPPTDGEFTTIASWYGPGFHGNRTASGATFDQNKLTAASPNLPFGTEVTVKNLRNGRKVNVVINDRGPFIRGRGIDLSKAAAVSLGIGGTARVLCTTCGPSSTTGKPEVVVPTVAGRSGAQTEPEDAEPVEIAHSDEGAPVLVQKKKLVSATGPTDEAAKLLQPIRHLPAAGNSLNPRTTLLLSKQEPTPARIAQKKNPQQKNVQRDIVQKETAQKKNLQQKNVQKNNVQKEFVQREIVQTIQTETVVTKPVQPTSTIKKNLGKSSAKRLVAHHSSRKIRRGSRGGLQTYIASARTKGSRLERKATRITFKLARTCRGIARSLLASL